VFLLVPAHPGSPGQRAVKQLLLLLFLYECKNIMELLRTTLVVSSSHIMECNKKNYCMHIISGKRFNTVEKSSPNRWIKMTSIT